MTKGFEHIRVGHAGAHLNKPAKRATSCATGGMYTNPTNAQSVDSANPLNITWDATCLQTDSADIYLFAPSLNQPRIHIWQNVDFTKGYYETPLAPKWWNDSASISLQLSIVAHGTQPFLSPLPAGPMFTATYTAPASGSAPSNADTTHPDSGIQQVNNFGALAKHHLSGGKVAASVIMPLLIVIAAFSAWWFRNSRKKSAEKRKRFSEHVDKRMSTISSDWKSMGPAGAQAAIRNSMHSNAGNRASSFSFGGGIRPQSTVAVEGGQAGIGARGLYSHENASVESNGQPAMSQLRQNARIASYGERVSRVSFADGTRPSIDSRRTVTSRAFHTAIIPPMPNRADTVSPTQANGPQALSADDIRERISGHSNNNSPTDEEMYPALSMMRHGGDDHDNEIVHNDYLFDARSEFPLPPTPVHATPESPSHTYSNDYGMAQPASVMSPDEMMRAYATRKASAPNTPNAQDVSFPAPVVSYNGNGMRTLYAPTSPHQQPQQHYDDPYGGM